MPGDCDQNRASRKESTHTLKSLDSWFDVSPAPQHLLAPRGKPSAPEDTGASGQNLSELLQVSELAWNLELRGPLMRVRTDIQGETPGGALNVAAIPKSERVFRASGVNGLRPLSHG